MINLHDLPIFSEHPVEKSFTGYVLSDLIPLELPTHEFAFFQSIDLPFAYDTAKHVLVIADDKTQLEFYIICKGKTNQPKSMAFRVFVNGEIKMDSLSYVHYVYQPHDKGLILEALSNLPKQKAMPIALTCHCPKH